MGRKTSQADEHPTEELLESSSFTSRSDNWGENVERNHASFLFEKRNGIEVVPCQDVEVVPYPYDEDRKDDVKEAKRAAVRSAQRNRLALQIILIFIVVVILLFGGFWMGISFGGPKASTTQNTDSSGNPDGNIDSDNSNPSESTDSIPSGPADIPLVKAPENGRNPWSDQSEDEPDPVRPVRVQHPEVVVLRPNESMDIGEFVYSPNGRFKVGITDDDFDFVLIEEEGWEETVIWAASMDTSSEWIWTVNGTIGFLQTDGNFVLRDEVTREKIWTTRTNNNPQATMVLDDSGVLSVKSADESRTVLWMEGVPREQYTGPSSDDMEFPIRGAFYYPWYPQTWKVDGHLAHYNTSLGLYSSSDPEVARAHVDAMDYGRIQLSIASWWGPGTHLDRSRLTMLMDKTIDQNSPLKWTVYHEDERDFDQTPYELQQDLEYLKKWFAWHPAWAHKDGKPVIFVYNEAGCEVASRWVQASRGEWYVVLKLFGGFLQCPDQPDSWHQYGVGKEDGVVHNPGHSFVIAPGFWHARTQIPMLERMNKELFCSNAQSMVQAGDPWQLIVSFNEAGEGTLIEPSPDWDSPSGYGDYLDCLHNIS